MFSLNNLIGAMDAANHSKNSAMEAKGHVKHGKNKLLILLVFNLFFFSSCGKNDMNKNIVVHDYRVHGILYAKGSKLKHISYVESITSKKNGTIISQYEYDKQGRISKESQPMYEDGTPISEGGNIVGLFSYSDYVYNNKGLLEKIIYYHSNIYEGFMSYEIKTYSYDKGGNKRKEVIEYPRALPFRTDSTLYYYENNRLKREDKYFDGYHGNEFLSSKLVSYIEYEYDNQGKLVKEVFYSAEDNKPHRTVVHNYQDGLNVKTEVFNNYFQNDKFRETRRYYDKNDNLIYLESAELASYSSAMSYVSKYEYSK